MSTNDDQADLQTLTIAHGRFTIGKLIGKGSFGQICLGYVADTAEKVAIKLEPTSLTTKQLPFEYTIYRDKLNSSTKAERRPVGIPTVYYYGPVGRYDALVIEYLGPTLQDMFDKYNCNFSLKTICQIAIQLINRIQYIHSCGIIYRDVKPENFLLGNQDDPHKKNIIYITDFGLSKEYIQDGQHIPFRKNKPLTGTARYMSINTHNRVEQSRRDDMEAIGHVLFYFLRKRLPWQGLAAASTSERYRRIGEVKKATAIEELLAGPAGEALPSQFGDYLRATRALSFAQTPDYNRYRAMFRECMAQHNLKEDGVYDWNH